MNINNFADWEITDKLPLSYNNDTNEQYRAYIVKDENDKEFIQWLNIKNGIRISDMIDFDCQFRIAWTWEDIRLYLKNKGYIIDVESYVYYDLDEIKLEYELVVINIYNLTNSVSIPNRKDIYSTYEEARKVGIITALNHIDK